MSWHLDAIDVGTLALALDDAWLAYVTAQLERAPRVRWALGAAADDAPEHLRPLLRQMVRRDPRETYWKDGRW